MNTTTTLSAVVRDLIAQIEAAWRCDQPFKIRKGDRAVEDLRAALNVTDEAKPPSWRDRMTFDLAVSESSPVIRGTRVTVKWIVSLIIEGWAWGDILRAHPELIEDDIRACLEYQIENDASGGPIVSTTDNPSSEPITRTGFRRILNQLVCDDELSRRWQTRTVSELTDAYAAALTRADAAEARAAELERERDALTRYRIARASDGTYRVFGLCGMSSDREYPTEAEAINDVRRCVGLDAEPTPREGQES